MDELAYFQQMDAAALVHGALFMMLWAGGIVSIDYWVGGRRSDSPPARDWPPGLPRRK
jgi:hypothetical protein